MIRIAPPILVTSYFNNGNISALQTIVTPAANLFGIRIIQAIISANSQDTRVMAKATAPASINDAGANTIMLGKSTGVVVGAFGLIISPGLGLYIQSSNTTAAMRAIEYEVLLQ